jgi:RHS repeat-associated protein
MVRGGVTYRIVTDNVGSVRLVVNTSTGAIAQRTDYDEFGQITNEVLAGGFSAIPFGFAGGLLDRDTGLSRFGARDYDGRSGRWTSKDALGIRGGSTNFYQYANADPVNVVDLNGKNPLIIAGAVIGFLSGASGAVVQGGNLTDILLGGVLGAAAGAAAGAFPILATPYGAAALAAGADLLGQATAGIGRILRVRSAAEGPVCIPGFTPNWGAAFGAGLGGAVGASFGQLFTSLPAFATSTAFQQGFVGGLAGLGSSLLGPLFGYFNNLLP